MSRLDTVFAAPWVEVARDADEARDVRDEQLGVIPQLTRDAEKYADVAWNARLARANARAADACYLLLEYDRALELSNDACDIFLAWDKTNAAFLNQLRIIRSKCQLGEAREALDWYNKCTSSPSKQRKIYEDWIDIGFVECLVANGEFEQALERFERFISRWKERPNVDMRPYEDGRELLIDAINSSS